MFKRPIVLLDCDGVMADFSTKCIEFINQRTGRNYTIDDVTEWDIFQSLGQEDLEPALDAAINIDEFCLEIPVLQGTKEALKELRKLSTVVCVTAPHHAVLWPGHRSIWLQEKLGFDKQHIAQIHSKFLVFGDVFVDDNGKNVSQWKKWWMKYSTHDCDALLWDRLYNRHHYDENVTRVFAWDDVIGFVENKANAK